jgi:hypothetical protein
MLVNRANRAGKNLIYWNAADSRQTASQARVISMNCFLQDQSAKRQPAIAKI